MTLTRRKFLAGIAAVAAAPLVVKADVISAVRPIDPGAMKALLELRMLRAHQMMIEAMKRDLFSITGVSDFALGRPRGLAELIQS